MLELFEGDWPKKVDGPWTATLASKSTERCDSRGDDPQCQFECEDDAKIEVDRLVEVNFWKIPGRRANHSNSPDINFSKRNNCCKEKEKEALWLTLNS